MAAPNKEGKVSVNLDEKLNSEANSDDDSDLGTGYGAEGTSGTENKPESVSMFCKNCLNPYSGAQKSGTFVLKCTACGQTDTVLHEEAAELDPEEIVGNLMMNRYLQVLREQEDININIGDPDFIDDNFKGISSAISDFCIYVNAIAERALEKAKEEKRASEEKMFGSVTSDKTESACDSEGGLLDVETGTTIARDIAEEIQTLRSSVLKVIAVLIRKYKLPADVWIGIERRIRNPNADDDDDKSDTDDIKTLDDLEKSGTVTVNTLDKGRKGDSSESGAVGNISDIKSAQEGLTKTEAVSVDKVAIVDSVVSEPLTERITEEKTEEPNTVFGMDIAEVRSTLDDEVLGKLGSKFKVCRGKEEEDKSGDDTTSELVDNLEGGAKGNSTDDALDKEIMQKLGAKIHFKRDFPDELDPIISSILTKTECIKDTLAATNANSVEDRHERETMAGIRPCEVENKSKESLKPKSEETADMQKMVLNSDQVMTKDKNFEELEVSFQAVSNAFLHELQFRKKFALKQRKKKALTLVGARLIAIKHQIMDVERQIRRELHTAYEKKLEKAENQKQMLAEKQIDIENVEDLLNHYIATGQMDKVAELMRILNSANQDN